MLKDPFPSPISVEKQESKMETKMDFLILAHSILELLNTRIREQHILEQHIPTKTKELKLIDNSELIIADTHQQSKSHLKWMKLQVLKFVTIAVLNVTRDWLHQVT